MNIAALVLDAVEPVIAGTAFEEDTVNNADARSRTSSGRSAHLIWCVGSPKFRARHPDVPDALDSLHPDGCTDLTIEVDEDGLLQRVDIEVFAVADDLAGRPVEDVLSAVVDRLTALLHRDDRP
jgi:hypothetical protein